MLFYTCTTTLHLSFISFIENSLRCQAALWDFDIPNDYCAQRMPRLAGMPPRLQTFRRGGGGAVEASYNVWELLLPFESAGICSGLHLAQDLTLYLQVLKRQRRTKKCLEVLVYCLLYMVLQWHHAQTFYFFFLLRYPTNLCPGFRYFTVKGLSPSSGKTIKDLRKFFRSEARRTVVVSIALIIVDERNLYYTSYRFLLTRFNLIESRSMWYYLKK